MSPSKPVILRSSANPTVRHVIRMRDNRARRKAARVLVDGWRETFQAIDAGLTLRHLYLPESLLTTPGESERHGEVPETTPRLEQLQRRLGDLEKVVWMSDALLERIAYGDSAREVVAEFDQPERAIDALRMPANPLVLVLDRIEKPGNVGAIFRCADAAGADAVLLCESGDQFNPNAIRSSQGCVFHVPSAAGTESDLRAFLTRNSIDVVAARVESAQPLWTLDMRGPMAIVVGNEAGGLGDRWQDASTAPIAGVRIPMAGSIDSLNVSVSAALLMFEAVRQRGAV